jgi:hypothetical protein
MEIIEQIISSNFNKDKEKKQIVLTHTARPIFDYLNSLKYRFNGDPIRLPHYLIGRDGKILQVSDDFINGNFTSNNIINYKSIVICLENLGWLEKVSLKYYHTNWIGNIYKQKVFDRKWRDYYFWEPYTDKQMESTVYLCKKLCEIHNIELRSIGHNTKVKGVESFFGILTRSNFDDFATDLSPAFDFEKFDKLLKDE